MPTALEASGFLGLAIVMGAVVPAVEVTGTLDRGPAEPVPADG